MKYYLRKLIEWLGFKECLDYISIVGAGTLVANFIFQRVFRIDAAFPYMKHFTSRMSNGKKIKIIGDNREKIKLTRQHFATAGGCFFNGANGIEIGEGTIFSQNVVISSTGHDFQDISKGTENSPIKIGKDVWIGANTVIMPGIVIADDCIVGAGSIVTKSFTEQGCVIAGAPAKVLKKKGGEL